MNIYSECVVLAVDCAVFTNPDLTTAAPDGFYSDHVICYQVVGGKITTILSCGAAPIVPYVQYKLSDFPPYIGQIVYNTVAADVIGNVGTSIIIIVTSSQGSSNGETYTNFYIGLDPGPGTNEYLIGGTPGTIGVNEIEVQAIRDEELGVAGFATITMDIFLSDGITLIGTLTASL